MRMRWIGWMWGEWMCVLAKRRIGVEVGGTEVGGKVPVEHTWGWGGDIRG